MARKAKKIKHPEMPRTKDLLVQGFDDQHRKLSVSVEGLDTMERELRLSVIADLPDGSTSVITQPVPAHDGTLIFPRSATPSGSLLWVAWVQGNTCGRSSCIAVA